MPNYFFDVIDAGTTYTDPASAFLPDDGEARDEAVALVVELARHLSPGADHHEIVVSARGETGRVVYEANLKLSGRWGPGRH